MIEILSRQQARLLKVEQHRTNEQLLLQPRAQFLDE